MISQHQPSTDFLATQKIRKKHESLLYELCAVELELPAKFADVFGVVEAVIIVDVAEDSGDVKFAEVAEAVDMNVVVEYVEVIGVTEIVDNEVAEDVCVVEVVEGDDVVEVVEDVDVVDVVEDVDVVDVVDVVVGIGAGFTRPVKEGRITYSREKIYVPKSQTNTEIKSSLSWFMCIYIPSETKTTLLLLKVASHTSSHHCEMQKKFQEKE